MALAQSAGQTVVAAAVTDLWESARGRFARLLGRGDVRREAAAEWLDRTQSSCSAAPVDAELGRRRSGGRADSPICWMKTLA